jgi:O-antigen ligase
MSKSRGPLFGFFATLIFGFILGKRWKEIGVTLVICILFILLVEKGIFGIRSLFERGMADRIDIWTVTLKRLFQAPFLGEGYFPI